MLPRGAAARFIRPVEAGFWWLRGRSPQGILRESFIPVKLSTKGGVYEHVSPGQIRCRSDHGRGGLVAGLPFMCDSHAGRSPSRFVLPLPRFGTGDRLSLSAERSGEYELGLRGRLLRGDGPTGLLPVHRGRHRGGRESKRRNGLVPTRDERLSE